MTERRHYSDKTRLEVFREVLGLLDDAARLWLEYVEREPPESTTSNRFLGDAEEAYFRRCAEIGREAYGATDPVRLEMGGPADWDLESDDFIIVRHYGEEQ